MLRAEWSVLLFPATRLSEPSPPLNSLRLGSQLQLPSPLFSESKPARLQYLGNPNPSLQSSGNNLNHSLQSSGNNLNHSLQSSGSNLSHSLQSLGSNLSYSLLSLGNNLSHSLLSLESPNLSNLSLLKSLLKELGPQQDSAPSSRASSRSFLLR